MDGDSEVLQASYIGTQLTAILEGDDIQPGQQPSYQLCKDIYLYHPLGGKMVDRPIKMAMGLPREITVDAGPEEILRDAFNAEWKRMRVDQIIANVARHSRIYGVGSVIMMCEGIPSNEPIPFDKIASAQLSFNVLDPLNTAGSIVLNQDPNALDFQKVQNVTAAGQPYHRSRACVLMNEEPIYISFTNSAFGFSGRSVYQRALYPLKSFIRTMRTDDMVSTKGGLLIAAIKQAGSIINNAMQKLSGIKRMMLKSSGNGDVLQIGAEDKIESLDLNNLEKPLDSARNHILANIATAADMPAIMLNSETFTRGFGEGTEDAKEVASYIDDVRKDLQPLYDFFTPIVQYRAWNKEFFEALQSKFEGYQDKNYNLVFAAWINSFKAEWPSYIKEPDSEKAKVDDIRVKSIQAIIQTLGPLCSDQENKALLVEWASDNLNNNKFMFRHSLELDIDAIRNYVPPAPPAFNDNSDDEEKLL